MLIQGPVLLLVILSNVKYSSEINEHRSKRAIEIIQSCPSLVYCQGDLLDTVQRFRPYTDSKTFVDLVQKNPENVTLNNFKTMMNSTNNQPNKTDVEQFLDENFVAEAESDSWTPTDFVQFPEFLKKVNDPDIKSFAEVLVSYWNVLGRRVKDTVNQNLSQHSLIPMPQPFIVPGGRFREIYYWDSYWIIKGLLLSEMKVTVKGMLDNFIYLIKTYGYIPNGARIYYLNRSQPPLFTEMVARYIEYTNDIEWLQTNIDYIENELLWWLDRRTINITANGQVYQVAHYAVESNTPRPESYAEDVTTCAYFRDEEKQRDCYSALKSGAESGWDFTTRWIFDAQGGTDSNLTSIDCKRAIPADLNAYLCGSFRLLSGFYSKIGNTQKQTSWADYADKWLNIVQTLMYNETDGIWYDYDSVLLQQRRKFFASNFAPLWSECYNSSKKDEYGKRAAQYIYDQGIDKYLGGIPMSLENSGEQWDMPNAWPPLQDIVVTGLYKTGNAEAKRLAEEMANRWIWNNYRGFSISGVMYEKYDAVEPGMYGGGGEYTVQTGFGWSNGVVLSFINQFSSARMSKAILSPFFYIVTFSSLTFVRKLLCF